MTRERMMIISVGCLIMAIILSSKCHAKDFDFSVTGGVGYDAGTLASGTQVAPTGTKHASSAPWFISAQISYNKWWANPVIDFEYRRSYFDFSDWEAPVQECNPEFYSLRFGAIKDFKIFSAYFVMGVTFSQSNARIIEVRNRKENWKSINPYLNYKAEGGKEVFHHQGVGDRIPFRENLFSMKVGINKSWKASIFRIGPELALEIFPKAPGWSKCREFSTNNLVPTLGTRIQY